jgi:predicted amidohydrolase
MAAGTTTLTLVQLTEPDAGASTLARMPAFFEQAAAAGSDLIAFPEYCLGRRIPLTHERVLAFRELARQHGIYAIAGLIEQRGARWRTTAVLVGRDGELIGTYVKAHPAAGLPPHCWPPVPGHDDEARGELGDGFEVFALDVARVGILQCYDGYFPEAWACTAYAGAEIIVWINGRPSPVQDAYCIAPAHAHGVVVAATVSDGCNTGFAAPRCACISAPGEPEEMRLFPRLPDAGDGCVHATIDLDELRRHRKHLRTLHQRRPDLYGACTRAATAWQDYPDIPWEHPACPDFVNRAQLPPPDPTDAPPG